jgi:chloramphenicol 3-O-phosphotransferase
MDDAAELYLDIDLDRFLELLKVSSLTKAAGPFSWQAPYKQEGGVSCLSAKSGSWAKTTSSAR